MRTIVGFSFTEAPIFRLKKSGFSLLQSDDTLRFGYREFLCPLSEDKGLGHSIEFREIIDENAYFEFQNKRDLSPFETEKKINITQFKHENGVISVEGIFGADMPEGEVKDYLKIRKNHSIWMVLVKCGKLSEFIQRANPDHFFEFMGKKGALLHMGSSCFDLLIISDT